MTKLQTAVNSSDKLDFCVELLHGGMDLGKRALQIELAVGLYVFFTCGSADINAKKVLRGIYASAGQVDCIKPGSPSYTRVANRMTAIAGLYDKLRRRRITDWIGDHHGAAATTAIIEGLKSYEFMVLDDVTEFWTGKTRKQRKAARVAADQDRGLAANDSHHSNVIDFHRRVADDPKAIHIEQPHIRVDIDRKATAQEIQTIIMELTGLLAKRSLKTA